MTEFEKYHKIKIVGNEDNEGIFDDAIHQLELESE